MKRFVLWIQTLTLLVDQGLWTQVSVLHLSCAKAASLSKGGKWENAVRPKQGFNQCHMMPIKCTTVPSMLILLYLTDKLHIDTKKNCFVTSCDKSSISPKGKTVDKDSTKASNGFKTCTETRFCEIKMKNHPIVTVLANCKR